MASWARQRQQITEAADGGARARTGADGAVVLNLRRGPGAYTLLSRADGQLTRAGQHYYSHLGLLFGLRRALLHVQGREAGVGEAGGARALPGRGEAWRRFDAADVQPGLFWCEDLREARRQLMAGESPKVAISSPAQYCIVETGSDDGRFMAVRGPITLRHLRFRLTDLEGQVVRLRGSSLSFVLFLDHV